MFTRVKIRRHEAGYLVDFDDLQWRLVSNVVGFVLDHVKTSDYSELLIGAAKEEALSIRDRGVPAERDGHVTLAMSLHQLHVLHATLVRACVGVGSEETFYHRVGFFAENVRELAFGIENAVGDDE
ncbi:hypothetical protein ACQP08_13275 [Micromonospora zamorensis]|uniref:hypothetical protein n=1 Tax=Micromonospora zamorensis TaxID=709883 RepID=UPI003D8ADDF6